MFIVAISNVVALSQPLALGENQILSINAPVSPDTTINDECIAWDIKDAHCGSGEIRIYDQCQKTVSGNIWQQKSEDCKDYGNDMKCIAGTCKSNSSIFFSVSISFLMIAVAIFLIYKIKRKKR